MAASPPSPPTGGRDPRIVLVTVPHCRLCDLARPVVAQVAADAGEDWRELDLMREGAADPSWWDNVPIVLVDGETAATLRVDAGELAAAVRASR